MAGMTPAINGDLSLRVVVDTHAMEWSPSPSGSVWRKRVHLVGPPESGQVTSVVRYEPASTFPAHDHPAGEEILVLDGVFSDEHGDWGKGSYLLNPEGFRHAPFSRAGCLLFVKLRQFPGRDRRHVAIDTLTLPWQPGATPGISMTSLYQQPGYADSMRLERWQPGARSQARAYAGGAELFVLEGTLADESGRHAAGSWLRFPPGATHRAGTDEGCTLYVKEGGFAYLESARP
jgi:anti-sigma factor ChrR (cupin superfamily)